MCGAKGSKIVPPGSPEVRSLPKRGPNKTHFSSAAVQRTPAKETRGAKGPLSAFGLFGSSWASFCAWAVAFEWKRTPWAALHQAVRHHLEVSPRRRWQRPGMPGFLVSALRPRQSQLGRCHRGVVPGRQGGQEGHLQGTVCRRPAPVAAGGWRGAPGLDTAGTVRRLMKEGMQSAQ